VDSALTKGMHSVLYVRFPFSSLVCCVEFRYFFFSCSFYSCSFPFFLSWWLSWFVLLFLVVVVFFFFNDDDDNIGGVAAGPSAALFACFLEVFFFCRFSSFFFCSFFSLIDPISMAL